VTRRDNYDATTDAILSLPALTRLSTDDRKRLTLALLDQLGAKEAFIAPIAVHLGVIYRDGDVMHCWACARLATVERTRPPAGFGELACDRCDELEREAWARCESRDRRRDSFDDSGDALRDDRKEQRIQTLREVVS